ncbi:MAG: glycosyltransferase family 4 protein [Phycisphaerales bacterium]|nr:glycosyltransferase family 4 protein [Phycisphaerales bacterium]
MRSEPLSICFVAPNNYAILSGRGDIQQIGGAEVQRALLARDMARRGHHVSFVTYDHGQPDGIEHDGVRVFKMCRRDAGFPGVRFFLPRWTSLCAAMRRANADFYYQRTAGAETGQTAMWCRSHGRRFTVGIANDPECDERLGGADRPLRERRLYRYGLLRADRVIAQTFAQQRALRDNFGIEATVIRNCAPQPVDWSPPDAAARIARPRALWIGRFARHKRLAWVADLARRCPAVHFDVVGTGGERDAETCAAIDALRKLSNVTMHGFLAHDRAIALYRDASVLLSTSAWEGFPNVFLEAWSRGVPTVSTLDPDEIVQRGGFGLVAGSIDGLAAALQEAVASRDAWAERSERALRHFREHHSIEAAVDAFERTLRGM